MTAALEGLRVLDLTSNLSGPYCAMILADQGADVIKIERPGSGDDMRATPPFVGGESAPFMLWNRNKRSIALDLKSEEGRTALDRLIETADVFLENFKPGVAERLGFGYEALSKRHPKLIYASISGFGQDGPYRPRGGFDLITQAMSGLMSVNGPADGPPHRMAIPVSDLTAGMFGAIGILTALAARNRTGEGQLVDVSLMDSATSMGVYEVAHVFAQGTNPERLGQAHRGSSPYRIFPTRDGWIALGASTNVLWPEAAKVLGLEHLVEDPRFLTKADRVKNNDALVALIAKRMAMETTQHWWEKLDAVGVPAGPVQDYKQVLSDPQILAREMVVEVDHPAAGATKVLGTPVKLHGTPGGVRRPAPTLGQHTDEILSELGLAKVGVGT